jgi:excisionase family DNA binding protein
MPPFPKRWISPKEAGEYLSLSTAGVRRLMARGIIPSVKLGHSRRFDLRELEVKLEKLEGRASMMTKIAK